MFKDKVGMKRLDVKRDNTRKFGAISLIHAKRNLINIGALKGMMRYLVYLSFSRIIGIFYFVGNF